MLVIFRGFSEAFENSSIQVSFEFKHDAHMEAGKGRTRIRDVTTLFYQLLDSNLFTHRNTYAILRETTSETYGPGSILHHISFQSILLCNLYFQSIS